MIAGEGGPRGRWGGMGRVCLGTTGYFLLHGEKQADEDAAWGPVSLSFSLFTAKTTRRIHSGPCNTAVTPQPPPFTPHTELSTVFLSSDHLSPSPFPLLPLPHAFAPSSPYRIVRAFLIEEQKIVKKVMQDKMRKRKA